MNTAMTLVIMKDKKKAHTHTLNKPTPALLCINLPTLQYSGPMIAVTQPSQTYFMTHGEKWRGAHMTLYLISYLDFFNSLFFNLNTDPTQGKTNTQSWYG